MMPITMTMPLAMGDIDTQSELRLISIKQFPPLTRPAAPDRFLIQFEVDREVEDDVDRLSVERAGFEFPLFHRLRGGLIEPERQRLEGLPGAHVAVLVVDG